tara:strand:+ start:1266 stop:3773 length:2508 start_codon:yes stop_codon:yes gene_type:complete
MAKIEYLVDIDLNTNQLLNVKLQHLSSDPTAVEGQIFYHSGSNVLKFHNGTAWISLSSASGDITAVVAGNGLTGGANAGSATLTVGAGNGITVNTNSVAVTAAQTTITTVTNAALKLARDTHNFIDFGTDDQIKFTVGTNQAITFKPSGEIEATKFDGALEGNADTATLATNSTHVLVSDNETTNESNELTFVEDAAAGGAQRGLESSAKATFNPSTGKITATGFIGALTGNADTVTTNANLTGHITSSGNAAVLGSFTIAQLSAALSNASISGNNTGDQTTVSGSSGTVTSIGNLTGDVTSSNRATTIAAGAVHHGMLAEDIISGQAALTSGLASTDEFMISDAGTVKKMDVSVLQSYLQSGLTFTTNTDTNDDVSIANLKTKLAGGFAGNAVTIGDSDDVVTIGNDLTVTGDLIVSGDTVTVNTATLSVEDPMIKLASGNNAADAVDTGFYSKYNEGSTIKYAGLFRDVSADGNAFTFFDGNQAEPTTTVNTSGTGYDLADVVAGNIKAVDGFTGNVSGSAGTVTSIGNLTGHITSTNRGTVLGSFTVAQLSAALSNASISGNNTGDQTTVSGSSGTVTNIGSMNAGDVTSGGTNNRTLTLGDAKVTMAKLANVATDTFIGRTASGTGVPKALSKTEALAVLNVEDGATANQSNAEIRTAVEAATDSNVFTDADHSKLNGIETSATADQSKSDIEGLAIQTVGAITSGSWTSTDIAVAHGGTGASSASAARTNLGVAYASDAQALAGSVDTVVLTPGNLAARSFKATIGDGSATAFNIDHGLATRDVIVQLYDASSYDTVYAQVVRSLTTRVVVTFNAAPATNDIIVLITKID